MKNKRSYLGLILLLGLFLGCGEQSSLGAELKKVADHPMVYTTFYPTQYFTERIAGDLATVICPVPADADAIFWMPDEKSIQAYQKADLIILNGAEFAKWVQKTTLPMDRIVDTAKSFTDSFIHFEKFGTHIHGKSGEHTHQGLDGHTWVDPINATCQAREILNALTQTVPQHAAAFTKGFGELKNDLNQLDQRLKTISRSIGNQPLLASHPAYNYLARRYGWNIKNLDLDPGEMPSDDTFSTIRQQLKKHPAKYLIWEAPPLPEITVRMQAELGLESLIFSPCELMGKGDIDQGKDYFTVMNQNLDQLGKITKRKEIPPMDTTKTLEPDQEAFPVNPKIKGGDTINFRSIGTFHTNWTPQTGAPRQGILEPEVSAVIEIDPLYRKGLVDLEKFQHIIVIYYFNITKTWSPTVKPPGSTHQFGLFATRSPKRPNPIGFSIITLDRLDIEKGLLHVSGVDAFDGTKVLDIKPYLPTIDRIASPINRATEVELGHHDELMIEDPSMYQ